MKRLLFFSLCCLPLWAGTLTIDTEASWVKARAKATGHEFEAVPAAYTCAISLDGDTVTAVSFSFKVHDLKTGKNGRDKEMFHWLEVEKAPELKFQMTSLKTGGPKPLLVGDLNLHNTTQSVEIPISVTRKDGKVHLSGAFTLDTRLYQLPIIKKMGFLKVDPLVQVSFTLIGKE